MTGFCMPGVYYNPLQLVRALFFSGRLHLLLSVLWNQHVFMQVELGWERQCGVYLNPLVSLVAEYDALQMNDKRVGQVVQMLASIHRGFLLAV